MFTSESDRPGKYEGNDSQLLAEVVDSVVLEGGAFDVFGDVEIAGEYLALVVGRRYGFILREDGYGFVDVRVFGSVDEARAYWEGVILEDLAAMAAAIDLD